jgi:hypothetical protein
MVRTGRAFGRIPVKRIAWVGVVGAVVAVAILVVVLVVPFEHQHVSSISLPTPSAASVGECGELLQPEHFPSWFAGTASLGWTATGGPVSFWVNQIVGNNSGYPLLYNDTGTQGSGSISISSTEAYRFGVSNCNPTDVLVNVTLSIPYEAPLY